MCKRNWVKGPLGAMLSYVGTSSLLAIIYYQAQNYQT